MAEPIRLTKDAPYNLLGTRMTAEQKTEISAVATMADVLRERIQTTERTLAEDKERLANVDAHLARVICTNCYGSGGFNVRNWEGWTGDVNTCPGCNGTGVPQVAALSA